MNKKTISKVLSIILCILLAMPTVVEAKIGRSSSSRASKSSMSSSYKGSSSSSKSKYSLNVKSTKDELKSFSSKESPNQSTKKNTSNDSSSIKSSSNKTDKVKSGNFSKNKSDSKDEESNNLKDKSKKESDKNKAKTALKVGSMAGAAAVAGNTKKVNADSNKSSLKADSANFTVKPKTIDKNKKDNTSTNNSSTYNSSYYKNYSKNNFFSTNNAWFYYYALDKVFNNRGRVTEQDIARELEEQGYTEKEVDTIMSEGKREISKKKSKNTFKYIIIGAVVCILGWFIYIKRRRY